MTYKKIIATSLLMASFFSFIFASAASAAAANFNATVTTGVLIIRSGPGATYGKVGQLKKGAIVKVYEQKNGWYRIDTGKKWVVNTYLKKTTKAAVNKVVTPPTKATTPPAATPIMPADCAQAIKSANSYGAVVAKGCVSTSKTPKCLEANKKCEDRQNIAFAQCPQ